MNYLTVSGPKRSLEKFIKENSYTPGPNYILGAEENNPPGIPLLLDKMVPEPAEERIKDRDASWRYANWGCRHDLDDDISDDSVDANTMQYDFATAWTPIVWWVKNVCKFYPKLTFCLHYEEPGEDLIGDAQASNGEFVGDDRRSFSEEVVQE